MLSETLNPEEIDPPFAKKTGLPPEWIVAPALVPYPEALAFMEARVAAIAAGEAREMVWLVEHPPLYTAGVSAKKKDLIAPDRFEVFDAGRGGQYTYHGPGQRVVYVMLDLNQRRKDVRAFVEALERWLIDTLWRFNVEGHIRDGRVGVWVERRDKGYEPLTEDKIAAIGIKLRRWVSFHGISLNVEPDLTHFDGIVPCGITEHGVTSLLDLGLPVIMDEVDYALKSSFEAIFGPVEAK
ncbi:lipoyl(octanoyl) transferase LipB [Asticcacaulis taihuensis]|uniref:Octanoyltransferase n=1 Tax=Asticcacaulis taihuensis TaxID=260084 RepID=A0A1G4TJR0_9CAUL|nr:lipoyl(octanoyl) transferase LipB [Asticcacaulis taihuensis]SCW80829.1 lipoyl(octanoyl) transferase [Asticcacaulis taihuensis]